MNYPSKKYLITFIMAITPISSFASCIDKYPEKYDFSGRYTGSERKITLETNNKSYECFTIKKKQSDINIICSEDLSLSIKGANRGSISPKIKLIFKNKQYTATALRDKPSDWYELKQECLKDKMIESALVDYKLDGYEKIFKYKQKTLVTISTN